MRRLLRRPLTWMVAAEVMVVAALVFVAWHLVAGANTTQVPFVLPSVTSPRADVVPAPPIGVLFPPSPSGRTLLPGLNVDPLFWKARLEALNAAEAQFEALEWRIVHSALETVRRYVETVVIPAIERAEGGRKLR
jgi:hypothetical protein